MIYIGVSIVSLIVGWLLGSKYKIEFEFESKIKGASDQHPLYSDLIQFQKENKKKRMPLRMAEIERLHKVNFETITSTEARMLANYLGMYLYSFLKKYNLSEDLIQ